MFDQQIRSLAPKGAAGLLHLFDSYKARSKQQTCNINKFVLLFC